MSQERNELNAAPNMLSPEGGKFEVPEAQKEARESQAYSAEHREGPAQEQGQTPVKPVVPADTSAHAAPQKDEVLASVEHLLSEGLGDVYAAMPKDKQSVFRAKGEEVAVRIRLMIQHGKLKVQDVLKMIRDWLRMIPGVNKFFLEQEAKIKTDKISAYAKTQASKIHNSL